MLPSQLPLCKDRQDMGNDETENFDGSNVTNGKVTSLGLCPVCSFSKKQHYIISVICFICNLLFYNTSQQLGISVNVIMTFRQRCLHAAKTTKFAETQQCQPTKNNLLN